MAYRIKTPRKLSKAQEEETLKRFDEIISEISQDHLISVNSQFKRVHDRLTKSEDKWKNNIAHIVYYMLGKSLWKSPFSEENKIVLACAHYLCDPNDVIPDYVPEFGYIDDAYVVNMCLTKIYHENRTFHAKVIRFCERLED